MKPAWVLTLLLVLVSSASADIAPEPLGGGASNSRRPKGSKTMVAMVHEIVRISVSKDTPSFHVTFRMKNTGTHTETIQVGFPSNYKDELLNFSASINGKLVSVEHEVDSRTYEGSLGEVTRSTYWHVWPMRFPPGEEVTVDVRYSSRTGPRYMASSFSRSNPWSAKEFARVAESVLPADEFATLQPRLSVKAFRYILRSGAGWHGPIGTCRVEVDLKDLMVGQPAQGFGDVPIGKFEFPTPDRAVWEVKNLEPSFNLHFAMLTDITVGEIEELQNRMYVQFPDNPDVADICARYERQFGRFAEAEEIERRLFTAWQDRIALWGPDASTMSTLQESQKVWQMVSRASWRPGVKASWKPHDNQPSLSKLMLHQGTEELAPIVRGIAERLNDQAVSHGADTHSATLLRERHYPEAIAWCDQVEGFARNQRLALAITGLLACLACGVVVSRLLARRRSAITADSSDKDDVINLDAQE